MQLPNIWDFVDPWFFLAPFLLFAFVACLMCLAFRRFSSGMMTHSRCLNIAQHYERLSISELAMKCNMTDEQVTEAIEWGMKRGMPITIQDGYYVRLADPSAFTGRMGAPTRVETTVYLVICPHCSHKNQQGVTECENCGASL